MIDALNDIYFSEAYASTFLLKGEELFKFNWTEGELFFKNLAILRKVPPEYQGEQTIYDLETPYGYGGIRTNIEDEVQLSAVVQHYKSHCQERGIIAEFFRFHPIFTPSSLLTKLLDFHRNDRKTVYIDLSVGYDKLKSNYKTNLKRNLAHRRSAHLRFAEIAKVDHSAELFHRLYTGLMRAKNADTFYYFDLSYFKRLFSLEASKLFGIYDGQQLISAAVMLDSYPHLYYHLGATDGSFRHLNGAAIIFDRLNEQYASKGYKKLYLGGGMSGDPNDNLFLFKSKFSQDYLDFQIGGLIHDQDLYQKLYNQRLSNNQPIESKKFLQYRY